MAIPTDRLATLAAQVLAAVEAHYTTAGVALPDRRFWTVGLVAYDCEQLAVTVERVFGHEGNPAAALATNVTQAAGFALRAASIGIHLTRCVVGMAEDGTPPTPTQLEDAGGVAGRDFVLCLNAVVAAARAGTIAAGQRRVVLQDWNPIGPEGNYLTGLLRVLVSLDDA